jgi:hypothetical protein
MSTISFLHLSAILDFLGVLLGLAERRQQQADEQGDDGDHDEQLDEGETAMLPHDEDSGTMSRLG